VRAPTRPGPRPAGLRCGRALGPPLPRGLPFRSPSLSLRPRVSRPKARAHVRLLGPCYKTGRGEPSRRPRAPRPRRAPADPSAPRGGPTRASDPGGFGPGSDGRLGRPPDPRGDRAASTPLRSRRRAALSFQRFQALLTPFSGSFSPFLRSTSRLSVSPPCLALDGIYHPLGLQSRATRLAKTPTRASTPSRGGRDGAVRGAVTLSGRPFDVSWPTPTLRRAPLDGESLSYNSTPRGGARFRARASPASFATTGGIPVGFFSFA